MTNSSGYVRHYDLTKELIKNKLRKVVAHAKCLGTFQQFQISFEIPETYHLKLEQKNVKEVHNNPHVLKGNHHHSWLQ